jgi:hypothetical protein
MLQDTPFSFWTGNQVLTYTELQAIRQSKYQQHYPLLLTQVKEGLEQFSNVRLRREAFKILLNLATLALDLSCYNSAWVDFDNAVFEMYVLHSKISVVWMHRYLCSILDTTLRRLSNGYDAKHDSI